MASVRDAEECRLSPDCVERPASSCGERVAMTSDPSISILITDPTVERKLAQYERQPVEYMAKVVDFAWLGRRAGRTREEAHTPFDILLVRWLAEGIRRSLPVEGPSRCQSYAPTGPSSSRYVHM